MARTKISPTMMAISATGLILEAPFSCVLLLVVGVGDFEIEVGEDDIVGVLFGGNSGEAMAPSDPGFVGSGKHGFIGAPQRNGFCENEDSGNVDKGFGISPESLLPETLKSWRVGRLTAGMLPEKLFPSRRRVSRWVRWLSVAGISPEKLLWDRSRR